MGTVAAWPTVAMEIMTTGVPVNVDEMLTGHSLTGMKALHKGTRTVPTANGSLLMLAASLHV